ncbi:hypothetical protein BV25DRAFT_1829987 [Artomyces pyxidatus]|uniref:Uncharacterized protein n=1 Tax=Artomyces pyxidatus TaxID=48021 RepID=A0ACB8SR24_9AGAM|nr:hypothetical protein BV25DRAFT_1829987 [Artomyces pyxidatus]
MTKSSTQVWDDHVVRAKIEIPHLDNGNRAPIQVNLTCEMLEDELIESLSDTVWLVKTPPNRIHAPVQKLPNELLICIFFWTALDRPPLRLGPGRSDIGWITATHVCQRWRRVALCCQSLWRDVNVSNLSRIWGPEMLRRSAPGLFSLTTTWDICRTTVPDVVRSCLELPNISRLQELVISGHRSQSSPGDGNAFLNFLSNRKDPAPMLEVLQISNITPKDMLDRPLFFFPSETQHLRVLSLFNCSICWNSTRLTNLVHLNIEFSADCRLRYSPSTTPTEQRVAETLSGMHALESLVLRNVFTDDIPGDEAALAHPTPIIIELPFLTTLELHPVSSRWTELVASLAVHPDAFIHFTPTGDPPSVRRLLARFGGAACPPRNLSLQSRYVPYSMTGRTECRLVLSGGAATTTIDFPSGHRERAVDVVTGEPWGGLDLSELRDLSVSFVGGEACPRGCWWELFGGARKVASVAALGQCAADCLVGALHPVSTSDGVEVLFPLMNSVTLRVPDDSEHPTAFMRLSFAEALRARCAGTPRSSDTHTKSWITEVADDGHITYTTRHEITS